MAILEQCHSYIPMSMEVVNNIHLMYYTVIHLQFWAYGSWDSLFPISMSGVQNTIFNDKSAILLHPGAR